MVGVELMEETKESAGPSRKVRKKLALTELTPFEKNGSSPLDMDVEQEDVGEEEVEADKDALSQQDQT